MPRGYSFLLGILIAGLLLGLAGCGQQQGPEARIRALIGRFENAVEQGHLDTLRGLLSPTYHDRQYANPAQVLGTLYFYSRQHRDIHLFKLIRSIAVAKDGDHASAVVDVAMTGRPVGSTAELIALHADLYRFDVQFVRDAKADQWLVASSRWRRIDTNELLHVAPDAPSD